LAEKKTDEESNHMIMVLIRLLMMRSWNSVTHWSPKNKPQKEEEEEEDEEETIAV
jgi:hypothetical protein